MCASRASNFDAFAHTGYKNSTDVAVLGHGILGANRG